MNQDRNFIELVTVPFAANESRIFALSGQYFELIDAVNPVDVVLTDMYGAQRGLMRGAEASFNLKSTEFAVIQITSASAQTIRFAYGSGEAGTRRAAGSVNIANVPTVALQATDAALIRRPELPASNWRDNSNVAANTPLTVFAPGSNPNGAIIWNMEAFDFTVNSNNTTQVFIAKSSPPVSTIDGEVIAQSHGVMAVGTSVGYAIRREVPTRIGAGLGLYFISRDASASTASQRHVRFTLL